MENSKAAGFFGGPPLSSYQCEFCKEKFVVPSLAREHELRHIEEE